MNTMMLDLNDWICLIKCLVDAIILDVLTALGYIARWMVGFYAMDECGIDAMLYAYMYASVYESFRCNIEHVFNEIKT